MNLNLVHLDLKFATLLEVSNGLGEFGQSLHSGLRECTSYFAESSNGGSPDIWTQPQYVCCFLSVVLFHLLWGKFPYDDVQERKLTAGWSAGFHCHVWLFYSWPYPTVMSQGPWVHLSLQQGETFNHWRAAKARFSHVLIFSQASQEMKGNSICCYPVITTHGQCGCCGHWW